ncbi:unnamed protein product [Ilex paraguariensis]|uniref:Uncharacterized protein n=1 Tax=Ilex paraguariensis TaxID=185542 RepID=A0ABC8R2P9_9AQUA
MVLEARIAVEQIVIPKGEPVELLPRPSNIILLQKDLIRKYNLQSERVGSESDIRLRILPFQSMEDEDTQTSERTEADNEFDELFNVNAEANGSPNTLEKLPFLPD